MSSGYAQTLDNPPSRRYQTPIQLSGLFETAFGYGTPIERAFTHDDVTKNVYIRLNYNQWMMDGKPSIKREYYSSSLVGGVLYRYRLLAYDGKVPYYNPNNVSDSNLDAVRSGCCATTPTREITKKILDALYYGTFGTNANIDPLYIDPTKDGQPTERAQEAAAQMENAAEARKEAAEDNPGIVDRVLDGISSPFKALGNLSTAMSILIPTMVVGIGGTVIYLAVSKGRQLDVNNAINQQHRTIRAVGPDVAAAVVRKGA